MAAPPDPPPRVRPVAPAGEGHPGAAPPPPRAPPPPPPPPPGQGPGIDPIVQRIAQFLGIAAHKVQEAFAQLGVSPRDLLTMVLEGRGSEQMEWLARALGITRERLGQAFADAAQGSPIFSGLGQMAGGMGGALRDTADEVVDSGLELFAESIPRFIKRVLTVMVLLGLVFLTLALLAFVDQPLFQRILVYLAGVFMLALAGAMFFLAMKLQEATAMLRALAVIAKRWRAKRA